MSRTSVYGAVPDSPLPRVIPSAEAINRASTIAANPDSASDASDTDKLLAVADLLDVDDRKLGRSGTEVQDWLRAFAARIVGGSDTPADQPEPMLERLRAALLRLSDTLDPEEGPVILAWSVDRLAERLAQELDDDGAKCDCVNCNSGRPHSGRCTSRPRGEAVSADSGVGQRNGPIADIQREAAQLLAAHGPTAAPGGPYCRVCGTAAPCLVRRVVVGLAVGLAVDPTTPKDGKP